MRKLNSAWDVCLAGANADTTHTNPNAMSPSPQICIHFRLHDLFYLQGGPGQWQPLLVTVVWPGLATRAAGMVAGRQTGDPSFAWPAALPAAPTDTRRSPPTRFQHCPRPPAGQATPPVRHHRPVQHTRRAAAFTASIACPAAQGRWVRHPPLGLCCLPMRSCPAAKHTV